MTRRLLAIFLLLLGLSLPALPPAAQESTPTAVVERLQAALLEAMQNADRLGFAGRRALLEPVLSDAYDFDAIARVSAGPAWSSWSEADRARFAQLVRDVSIATYADRFDGFHGERFEVLGEAPGQRGTMVVRTRLIRPNDPAVALDYVLAQRPQGWRIVDVLLDGKFSELARQRAEYGAVLKEEGYAGLVGRLEAQLARMAQG